MNTTSLFTAALVAAALSFSTTQAKMEPGKSNIYSGEVTTTSRAAHTITVKSGSRTQTFLVGKSTKLSTGETASAKLGDFRFGEHVIVNYKDEDQGRTALSVSESSDNHMR